jgi:surface antigen
MIMWIFTEALPPKIPEPIQIVIQIQEVEPEAIIETAEKIYTIDEKIDMNFYECDESLQYIRADTAECLDKPVYTPITTQRSSKTIKNGSNAHSGWYPYGQCTYFVYSQRPVGQWNDARDWIWQAQRDGWSTGTTPVVGAIGQKNNHVVIVTSVNSNGTFNLSEMNYQSLGVITTRTVSTSGWRFIY